MEHKIGTNAGKLWKILEKKGEMSCSALCKEAKLSAKEGDRALGWLAREGKLVFQTKGKAEMVSLKPV